MAALDRLDWAAGLAVTSFGVRVGVRVDDAALLPELSERLPPGSRVSDSPVVDHLFSFRAGGTVAGSRIRRFHVGYNGWTQFVRTLDEADALTAFESAVRFEVAAAATPWVFVHAGVVGWNGRAILIPAPSTHGKSRLVEALVRAGATYYSDEFAVLDGRGRVHPFAKPLTLRLEAGERRASLEEMGGRIGSGPLPIGLIVSTQYEQGGTWQPRRATSGEAVLALLANTVRARIEPGPTLKTLARAVEGAVMLDGPRGEADRAARDVLRALDSSAAAGRNDLLSVGNLSGIYGSPEPGVREGFANDKQRAVGQGPRERTDA